MGEMIYRPCAPPVCHLYPSPASYCIPLRPPRVLSLPLVPPVNPLLCHVPSSSSSLLYPVALYSVRCILTASLAPPPSSPLSSSLYREVMHLLLQVHVSDSLRTLIPVVGYCRGVSQ